MGLRENSGQEDASGRSVAPSWKVKTLRQEQLGGDEVKWEEQIRMLAPQGLFYSYLLS